MGENIKANQTTEPLDELSEEETGQLVKALTQYMSGQILTKEGIPQDLRDILREFLLGLTFPSAVDVGPEKSRRWTAFMILSSTWHSPKTKALAVRLAAHSIDVEYASLTQNKPQ